MPGSPVQASKPASAEIMPNQQVDGLYETAHWLRYKLGENFPVLSPWDIAARAYSYLSTAFAGTLCLWSMRGRTNHKLANNAAIATVSRDAKSVPVMILAIR